MTREQIMSLQRQLQAAGLYTGPIDGRMGLGTRSAQEKFQQLQATNSARAAEAEAVKARAAAEAEMAKTEAARVAADAERQRAADKRAEDRAEAKRDAQGTRSIATGVGVFAGMGAGYGLSKMVDKRFIASVAAKNKGLTDLASVTARTGTVAASAAATRAGLTKARAPLGLGMATALIAEAAFTRLVVSPSLEDAPEAQAISDAIASGSAMAAIGLVGKQAVNRATPAAVLDAAAMATIASGKTAPLAPKGPNPGTLKALRSEAKAAGIKGASSMKKADLQKALTDAGKSGAAAPAKAASGGFKRLLGRALPGVAALLFAGAGYAQAANAGESQADAAASGAKAGADVLSGGAVSTFEEEKARSGSTAMALTRAVIEGVGNVMTFGLAGMIADKTKSRPTIDYVPESVQKRIDRERSEKMASGGLAYLNDAARSKAQSLPNPAMPAINPRLSLAMAPDGMTAGYMRIDPRTGKTVQVKGYRTPGR